MNYWTMLTVASSILQVQTYAVNVWMAANPLIPDREVRKIQRRTLGWKEYRRIWGYGHDGEVL